MNCKTTLSVIACALSAVCLFPRAATAQLAVYSHLFVETSEDNPLVTITAWGAASDESPECSGFVTVDVYVLVAGSIVSSWASSDWCGASTSTSYQMLLDDVPEEETSFEARATGSGNGWYHGCSESEELVRLFAARFRFGTFIETQEGRKALYTAYNCPGGCQPATRCIPDGGTVPQFITQRGLYTRVPYTPTGFCTFVTLHLGQSACSQPSGGIIGQWNDRCGGATNPRPQIAISYPPNGGWVASSGYVAVDTWDAIGNIPRVDYYINGAYLTHTTSAPFTMNYSGAAPGTYTVQSVAYDDAGDGYTVSSPITVNVH